MGGLRAGVRCRNGGHLHGRWYCNVMRFTRGDHMKPVNPGGITGQGRLIALQARRPGARHLPIAPWSIAILFGCGAIRTHRVTRTRPGYRPRFSQGTADSCGLFAHCVKQLTSARAIFV